MDLPIEWRGWSGKHIAEDLSHNADGYSPEYQAFRKLDHALFRFSHPRVSFVVAGPVDASAKMLSFWTHELGDHLPLLLGHGLAVTGKCSEALVSSASLHHDGVQALVISPDSQWVASGSMGSTIVLWDAATGVVLHRWGPHSYKPVRSLTFSPNGQYLLSGGDNGKATIWEVRRNLGADKVTNLNFEGYIGPVLTFAWSPDGGTIVTGSDDGTARLWDTRTMTYCQRAFCQLKGPVVCLAFFPDESCLSCGSNRGVCCIVNVASGSLHRYLWNSPSDSQDAENNDDDDDDTDSGGSRQTPHQMRDTIAAFDPSNGSTHLATALCGSCSGINTVDAVAGSVLAHIGGKRGELTRIATSPSRQMGRLSSEYPQRVQVREADCMSGMQLLASNASSSLDAQTVTPC